MRRIKSNELPDWFTLSRYEGSENLDLGGWSDNLMVRLIFTKSYSDENEVRHITTAFQEFTAGDRNLVSGPDRHKSGNGRTGPNPLYSGTPHSELNQVTVRSLPVDYCAFVVSDVMHANSKFSTALLSASEYLWEEINAVGSFDSDDEKDEFLAQPIDLLKFEENDGQIDDQFLGIEVDMFAPDYLIIDDFKKWLGAAREVFDIPSRNLFTNAGMNSWARNQVLPFIDLTLWAKFNGIKIPDPVMGAALFPNEYDKSLSEKIAKVVRPKAKWLTRPSVVSAIWHQSKKKE